MRHAILWGEKGEEDTPAGRRAKMLREMEEEEKQREAAEAEIEAEEEAAVEKLKEELMAMELEELRALAGGSKAKGRDLRGVDIESDWDDIEEMDDPKEEVVKRILEIEKPDALLAGMGGQTALNIASALAHDGSLDELGVELIGCDLVSIDEAEDRDLFKQVCESIDLPVCKAIACDSGRMRR